MSDPERPTMVNLSPDQVCWQCGLLRPSIRSINIMNGAAGSVPSIMKPICEDCAVTKGPWSLLPCPSNMSLASEPISDSPTEVPHKVTTVNTLRIKAGRLQQLHNDPHWGNRRFWLDVSEVGSDAPDILEGRGNDE